MARTQKNKATEYHLGQLKAKIAKLRTQLLEPPKGTSGAGEGFEVTKFGHGRVALIGFPSVGKSTLLTMLTGTHSEAASYEFTTLTCIPGIIHYNGTKIQLLDLPGIIEGASEGKGRGRQVIAVSKSSDIVLMVLDASKIYVVPLMLSQGTSTKQPTYIYKQLTIIRWLVLLYEGNQNFWNDGKAIQFDIIGKQSNLQKDQCNLRLIFRKSISQKHVSDVCHRLKLLLPQNLNFSQNFSKSAKLNNGHIRSLSTPPLQNIKFMSLLFV
ncbi:hypothetical protein ACHQM5_007223 [Ranunculus cassubicifolius]